MDPRYRAFELLIEQRANHRNPDGESFLQRALLLHRDEDAPMVMVTEGYFVIDVAFPIYLAELDANELRVEHRFFAQSQPEPRDWSLLSIKQAAADHHHVSGLLHQIYRKKWISTGGSKSGMASIYFRRFYPNDVDATVAFVAPNSFGPVDARYEHFLNHVGSAICRDRIKAYQVELLRRRPAMLTRFEAWANDVGLTYEYADGGLMQAFDYAVSETYYAFWQYGGEEFCDIIPQPDGSDDELFEVLTYFGVLELLADSEIEFWQPYFLQTVEQLGYPKLNTRHLRGLLKYNANDYSPFLSGIEDEVSTFDWFAMIDMYIWVLSEARKVMFIYGENDPWTAGAFAIAGQGRRDTYRYFVPGGNHSSDVEQLAKDDHDRAVATIERWSGGTWTPREAEGLRVQVRPSTLQFMDPVDHRLNADEREARTQQLRERRLRR